MELKQGEAQARLARAEKRLYSGEVKNPKELGGAEKDVQQLRRQLSQVEDGLLEALVCFETATQTCTEQQATVARLTADWSAKQATLRVEQAQLKARLPAELARQAAARQAVPPALLPSYERLRAAAAAARWPCSTGKNAARARWLCRPKTSRRRVSARSRSTAATAAGCCGEEASEH